MLGAPSLTTVKAVSLVSGRNEMMLLRKLRRDEKGATAIEYGLIAALLAVGLIAALGNLKEALNKTFNKVATDVGSAGTS